MIHHLHTHLRLLKNVQQKNIEKGKERDCLEKNWTREEKETLITLWEGNEILQNVSLLDYPTKDKKSAAVKQIAEQLNANEENVSKKWLV